LYFYSTPPDFPANNCEEKIEERPRPKDLNEIEKVNMGFETYKLKDNATVGERKALELHNKLLGLA
jgi:hypothetical protein